MNNATMAQVVEHILGKDEVIGSIPISSSKNPAHQCGIFTSSLFTLNSSLFFFRTTYTCGIFGEVIGNSEKLIG